MDKELGGDGSGDFEVGDCVAVTGAAAHSGECGLIVGFFRRDPDTLYAVIFENGWADISARNLVPAAADMCAVLGTHLPHACGVSKCRFKS